MVVTAPETINEPLNNVTTLTATSQSNPDVFDVARDIIVKPGVVLAPSYLRNADPGEVVTYTHWMTNIGPTDSFTLAMASSRGWGQLITPTGLVTLPYEGRQTVIVRVEVPFTAPVNLADVVTLTATSLTYAVSDSISDTTIAKPTTGPRYVRGDGDNLNNNCKDRLRPCASIAYALGQAAWGDTVYVAQGVYTETDLFINQMVTLRGGYDASFTEQSGDATTTVIDAAGRGRDRRLVEGVAAPEQPLIKKNGRHVPVTWDEALYVIGERFKPLLAQGDHGVAAIASTRLPIEALALFKHVFAQSDLVTSVEEGLPTARSSQLADELGPFEAKLEALKEADAVLTIGVDLGRSHQVAGFFVKRAQPIGTKLIVIDPHDNKLDPIADISIKPKPGADVEIIAALQAAARGETVADKKIVKAAQLIGAAKKLVIVYGKGLTASSDPKALKHLIEYARAVNAKVISVKGEANSLAAAQLGLDRPFALNGHQAVYAAIGDDYVTDRLLQRLEKAPFVVAQASYASKLTALADVVLPVEMWAEQAGHFVSLDGRVQQTAKVLTAPETVRSNVDALQAVAQQLGVDATNDWQAALHQRTPMVELA